MKGSSSYRLTKGRQTDRTTIQSTATAHKIVRRAGGGQSFSATREPDGEVRSDLKTVDQVFLDLTAGFTIEGFHSYGTYVEELEEVAWSTFDNATTQSISITDGTLAASGNTVASTLSDLSVLTVGEIVSISGATQFSGTTKYARVTASSSNSATLDDTWLDLTDEGSADVALTIKYGKRITEGTTMHYQTLEESFASDDWQIWPAVIGTNFAYTRSNKAKSGINTTYVIPAGISSAGIMSASSILTGGSPTAATTTRIMSHKHLTVFREGSAATTLRTTGNSFELSRSPEDVGTHGVVGAEDFVEATLGLSGSLDVVNEAAAQALVTKMRDDTVTGHAWKEVDAAGNVIWWDVPSVYYSDATRSAGGQDTKVMLTLPWAARMHPTYGFMFQCCMFDA